MGTNDSTQEYDSDDASIQLGKAWGLARVCTGLCAAGDPATRGEEESRAISGTLRFIASTVAGVEANTHGAPKEVLQAIADAAAVSRAMVGNVDDNPRGYAAALCSSEEVADWSLHALADAIQSAKTAVDEASCRELAATS